MMARYQGSSELEGGCGPAMSELHPQSAWRDTQAGSNACKKMDSGSRQEVLFFLLVASSHYEARSLIYFHYPTQYILHG
jgi:hypothetical protein